MQFDPTKLPDKELLKQSEVINFHAVGKALDSDAEAPADRLYGAKIDDAMRRCCYEARTDPGCLAFIMLFVPDPASCTELRACEASWPPSGEHLHDMTSGWERARLRQGEPAGDAIASWYGNQRKRIQCKCIEEALSRPECSPFLDLLVRPDDTLIPGLEQLLACKKAWPPSGQLLHDLIEQWEIAHEEDNDKREKAGRQVMHWLTSCKVEFEGTVVEGERAGCRERIDASRILEPMITGSDRIVAYPCDAQKPRPREPRAMLVWDDVRIRRSSVVEWYRPSPPDPADFDPKQEPFWTLAMAVVWVQTKSADAVREQWPHWHDQFGEQRTDDDGNFYWASRQCLPFQKLIEASPKNAEAWDALRQALHRGELSATRASTGATIPQSSWADPEDQSEPCQSDQSDGGKLDYDGVRLNSADVLHLSLERKRISSNQAPGNAERYLKPIMAQPKPEEMTRDKQIRDCAKKARVGVSVARGAYEKLLPDAHPSWRVKGRPPKSAG